jgi:SAM-dependent methyltransferase
VRPGATGTFTCKLCHGTQVARHYRLQRHTNTEPFMAATCSGCGLFQNVYDWQVASRLQRSLKLEPVDTCDPLWESERELAASRGKARAFPRVLDEVGLVRGRRILDVGCGSGFFLHECRSLGAASVTGQEFLRGRSIAYARNELARTHRRHPAWEEPSDQDSRDVTVQPSARRQLRRWRPRLAPRSKAASVACLPLRAHVGQDVLQLLESTLCDGRPPPSTGCRSRSATQSSA